MSDRQNRNDRNDLPERSGRNERVDMTTREMRMKQYTDNVSDFEHYLKSDLPVQAITGYLKAEGKSEGEIDALIEKIVESRKRVNKFMRKFIDKIERKYGFMDVQDLIQKAIKFAKKNDFSKEEENMLIKKIMSGDNDNNFFTDPGQAYNEMSKFLGFTSMPLLNIRPEDMVVLEEISGLYDTTKQLHDAVKTSVVSYNSCAPEAVLAKYDKVKDDISSFIHPVLAALFLPKIKAIEKRMLVSNIGRLIIQRSRQYLKKYLSNSLSTSQIEQQADMELMSEIARDPNSMNHFTEDTPLENLAKRFRVQIELWKNVISLRSGKIYSKSANDYISGLMAGLIDYEWAYFDNPEYYHVQDEGMVLRKLLAIFSVRPTFTQVSSLQPLSSAGFSNFGTSKFTFINTPIINVRLPNRNEPTSQNFIKLTSAFSQTENTFENKMIIPKKKSIIYSRDLLFFYINRRYQSLKFVDPNVNFTYMNMPGSLSSVTAINTTPVVYDNVYLLHSERFSLRSVVVLNKNESELTTSASSAMIISDSNPDSIMKRNSTVYFYYNPIVAGTLIPIGANGYSSNNPISMVGENSSSHGGITTPGFTDMARTRGTIFVYSGLQDDIKS